LGKLDFFTVTRFEECTPLVDEEPATGFTLVSEDSGKTEIWIATEQAYDEQLNSSSSQLRINILSRESESKPR
jgi:hypothetical protein